MCPKSSKIMAVQSLPESICSKVGGRFAREAETFLSRWAKAGLPLPLRIILMLTWSKLCSLLHRVFIPGRCITEGSLYADSSSKSGLLPTSWHTRSVAC